jgi:hypothetical protein
MKNIRLLLTLSVISLSAFCLKADTLSGNGSFQSWNQGVLGTATTPITGGPYWNNLSGDGPTNNIGWCLTGAGDCQISNPPGALSYYGNGTSAASHMSFVSNGMTQEAILSGIFTNQNGVAPNGQNYFGWYSVSNGAISIHTLLSSMSSIGSYTTFTPTANYGFFLENVQSAGLGYEADYFWFMDTSLNYVGGTGVLDGATQHFAVFSSPNSGFYIGTEDTPAAGADFDYNDMIFQVQAVPEPASICLLFGGLALIGFFTTASRMKS